MSSLLEAQKKIRILIKSGIPFSVIETSASMTIEVNGKKKFYCDEPNTYKWLHLLMKCRKHFSKIEPPNISRDDVRYRRYMYSKPVFFDTAYAVDISSAYTYALNINGYLPDSLFQEIQALPKKERLTVIGAASAGVKTIHRYNEKGELYEEEIIRNPYEPFFYFAAKEIENIMSDLIYVLNADMICFYTDCVYFTNEENIVPVMELLQEQGYKSKHETLRNFKVEDWEGSYMCTYKKEGETDETTELFFSKENKSKSKIKSIIEAIESV